MRLLGRLHLNWFVPESVCAFISLGAQPQLRTPINCFPCEFYVNASGNLTVTPVYVGSQWRHFPFPLSIMPKQDHPLHWHLLRKSFIPFSSLGHYDFLIWTLLSVLQIGFDRNPGSGQQVLVDISEAHGFNPVASLFLAYLWRVFLLFVLCF